MLRNNVYATLCFIIPTLFNVAEAMLILVLRNRNYDQPITDDIIET